MATTLGLMLRAAVGAAALALGVLAAAWPFAAIGLLAAVALGIVAWRRPEAAIAGVALLIPSGTVYPPLRIIVGPTYFTLFQVVVFGVAALTSVKPGAVRAGARHPLFRFGLALTVAGTIAALGSADTAASLGPVLTIGVLLMALSLALAERMDTHVASVHRTLVYLGSAVAALVVFEGVVGHAILGGLYSGVVGGFVGGGVYFRPSATIGNPLVASSVFVVLFALALTSPHIKRRYLCLGPLAAAALLSLSRSSTGLLVVIVLIFVLVGGGRFRAHLSKRRVLFLLALAPMVFLAASTIGPRLAARVAGRGIEDPIRFGNARIAVALWRDNWATGLGMGGFRRFAEATGATFSATVDNQYLTLLAELGTIGLFILLMAAFGSRLRAEPGRTWLPLVALMGGGLFFEVLQHDATILLLAIGVLEATERHYGRWSRAGGTRLADQVTGHQMATRGERLRQLSPGGREFWRPRAGSRGQQ